MAVLNVHERLLSASPDRVGVLLDSLGSPDDRLWPHERWPAMELDRSLGVGAEGGHGPIRYMVAEYEPGRRVVFAFTQPEGFVGSHKFEIEPAEYDQCVLRHTIDMHLKGSARLTWPLIFRPLHDALMEDALDKADAACGHHRPPREWPLRVRLLRWLLRRKRPAS